MKQLAENVHLTPKGVFRYPYGAAFQTAFG